MAHKRKPSEEKQTPPYTLDDAIKITDEIFKLSKDQNYHPGAFVHGLIFALEYAQETFQIPQQQIATIKRDCRKYVQAIENRKAK